MGNIDKGAVSSSEVDMTTRVSVAIPTHDRPQCLRRAVDSLIAQNVKPCEIIIVNDGSKELCPSIANSCRQAGVKFISIRRHSQCLPASRNAALDASTGDVVFLMDDDCFVDEDYIGKLSELFNHDYNSQVALIGGVIDDLSSRGIKGKVIWVLATIMARGPWCAPRCHARYVKLGPTLANRLVPVHRLTGGGISVRREIGVRHRFDESFGGWALFEDTEFCLRVGMSEGVFLAPELIVKHDPGSGGRPNLHNRGRMYVKNFLHIMRNSFRPGAGSWLLFFYGVGGIMTLYSLLSIMSLHAKHLAFVAGAGKELLDHAKTQALAMLAGRKAGRA